MGAGKSSVGKRLAEDLNGSFIDLDTRIEHKCKSTIQEIFDVEGEAFFRQTESEVLTEIILNHYDNIILSLGGGTLIKDENRNVIKGKGILIYLEASPEHLLKRIKADSSKRPLLENNKRDVELLTFIQKHLNERLQFYQKADITINTENRTPEDIVKELKLSIKQRVN